MKFATIKIHTYEVYKDGIKANVTLTFGEDIGMEGKGFELFKGPYKDCLLKCIESKEITVALDD